MLHGLETLYIHHSIEGISIKCHKFLILPFQSGWYQTDIDSASATPDRYRFDINLTGLNPAKLLLLWLYMILLFYMLLLCNVLLPRVNIVKLLVFYRVYMHFIYILYTVFYIILHVF